MPVEDQVVVSADLVDDGNRQVVLLRHVAEHLFAQGLLADGEGRGGKVDDGLCAGICQDLDGVLVIAPALPKVAVVPHVFADADAQAATVELQDLRAVGWLEVTIFVEHVVGGKQGLVEGRSDGAVFQKNGAVEEGAAHFGGIGRGHSHQQRRRAGQLARDAIQLTMTAADESLAHEQIAGEIAHEGQLRGHHQGSPFALRTPDSPDDERRVAGDIAGRRIDLKKRDSQG